MNFILYIPASALLLLLFRLVIISFITLEMLMNQLVISDGGSDVIGS